jgi:hypothetical protein
MRNIIIAGFLLIMGILLVACGFTQPVIAVDITNFDFGEVVNGEIATHDFIVRNEGNAPLTVESVITTCGCTTATLEPMTIPAGESGVLHVAFDSGAHGPDLTGEIIRQVFLASNDPDQPEVVVEIVAKVLARTEE